MGWPERTLLWAAILLTVLLSSLFFIADYPQNVFPLMWRLELIILIPFWLLLRLIAAPFRR